MAIDVLVGSDSIVANEKQFKTGSRGYFGTGKVEIDGKRYQCQVQLVEIGSKPVTPEMVAQKADARIARAEANVAKARAQREADLKALKGEA